MLKIKNFRELFLKYKKNPTEKSSLVQKRFINIRNIDFVPWCNGNIIHTHSHTHTHTHNNDDNANDKTMLKQQILKNYGAI